MIYTVVGLKNFSGNFEKEILLFHNHEEAYASLRRNMRNLVISEEINADTLSETKFCILGEFDTETGRFDNFEQFVTMDALEMCIDLIDDDAIPMIGVEDAEQA